MNVLPLDSMRVGDWLVDEQDRDYYVLTVKAVQLRVRLKGTTDDIFVYWKDQQGEQWYSNRPLKLRMRKMRQRV